MARALHDGMEHTLGPSDDTDGVAACLARDHERLDVLLSELTRALDAGDLDTARVACAGYRSQLARHMRVEEEIVFPLFEVRSGLWGGGPTELLREEHREVREALAQLCRETELGRLEASREALGYLEHLLHDHIEREERLLYPITDRLLAPRERVALLERLKRE